LLPSPCAHWCWTCAFASQLAVKLCRARIAELEAAITEAKAAGVEAAAAAAEKEIGGLEDSLDGKPEFRPCVRASASQGTHLHSYSLLHEWMA